MEMFLDIITVRKVGIPREVQVPILVHMFGDQKADISLHGFYPLNEFI